MSKKAFEVKGQVEQGSKKVYQQPQLQELGDVTELTMESSVNIIVQ